MLVPSATSPAVEAFDISVAAFAEVPMFRYWLSKCGESRRRERSIHAAEMVCCRFPLVLETEVVTVS